MNAFVEGAPRPERKASAAAPVQHLPIDLAPDPDPVIVGLTKRELLELHDQAQGLVNTIFRHAVLAIVKK